MLNAALILLALFIGCQFGWLAGILTGLATAAISAAIAFADNNTVHHDGWWVPREPSEHKND